MNCSICGVAIADNDVLVTDPETGVTLRTALRRDRIPTRCNSHGVENLGTSAMAEPCPNCRAAIVGDSCAACESAAV